MDIDLYDFKDHINSVEWIYSLPKGLVSEKIDIRFSTVTITNLKNGYQIYIGPTDLASGGDGIMINLDKDFQLMSYEIERIEPLPF